MKFVKVLSYIEKSFKGKPSFLILMSDGKEYISNGCKFLENTQGNRDSLVESYSCAEELYVLLEGSCVDFKSITNTFCMFYGCPDIEEFEEDLGHVTYDRWMFRFCKYVYKEVA